MTAVVVTPEMSTDYATETSHGVAVSWPVAGTLGGIAGAAAFGGFLWLVQPGVIGSTIPAAYGLETIGPVGWLIHLVHGGILGLVFGALISRPFARGVLQTQVETKSWPEDSQFARFVTAGGAFGLALWTILPVLLLPALAGFIGSETVDIFPRIAVESLLGHLLFGMVLGGVFSLTTDWDGPPDSETLEE